MDLTTTTMHDLDVAIERNLVLHMSWVPSRLGCARVVSSPSIVLVDSGFGTDTFNVACRSRNGVEIGDVLRFFDDAGRPFSWWVGPLDGPSDLDRRLRDAGFVAADPEIGMVCDLSRGIETGQDAGGLHIMRAVRPEQVADFAAVVAANWDPPDEMVTAYYAAAAAVLLGPDSPLMLFVGYESDRPVATAEVCISGGVAGLYGVATLKSARRRGYGLALTAHAMAAAVDAGARIGVLQSSPDGREVYSRVGFRPHGTYVEYSPVTQGATFVPFGGKE